METRKPLGVVLAGGHSLRFGVDKATVVVDGEALVVRTARILAEVLGELVVVGDPAYGSEGGSGGGSSLEALFSSWPGPPLFIDDPREGPLGAVIAAWRRFSRPLVVVACDLPRLNGPTVMKLSRPTVDLRVPVVALDGEGPRRQWLCAHYGAKALHLMDIAWEAGERSIGRAALEVGAGDDDEVWDPRAFADADTPEALATILAGPPL